MVSRTLPFDQYLGLSVTDTTPVGAADTQSIGVTPSIDAARWLDNALSDLNRLVALPPDWNSYTNSQVSAKAVANARMLLTAVRSEIPEPSIAPASGGGVSIEWISGPRELEIEVLADGSIEFLRVSGKPLDSPEAMREVRVSRPESVPMNQLVAWVFGG